MAKDLPTGLSGPRGSAAGELRLLETRVAEAEARVAQRDKKIASLLAAAKTEAAERERVERELRNVTDRYELIATGASDGVWDWDVKRRTVYYSPRWHELRGFEPADVTNSEEEWSARIHPEDTDRVRAALDAHFAGETEFFAEEYRVQCKDGSFKWVLDRGVAQRDEAGEVVRMAGSESDVTERRRAEESMRRLAARLRSAGDLQSSRLSKEIHEELEQTLSALKMEISLAAGDRTSAMLALVDSAFRTLHRIAHELHPKLLDDLGLEAAVEWQADRFERRTGVACTLDLEDLSLDDERSTAVFKILEESLVNVERHAAAKRVRVALTSVDGAVRLAVEDDGCGMDLENDALASGLGLFGMRERAAALGGEIEIRSRPGEGTAVRLSLPTVAGGSGPR